MLDKALHEVKPGSGVDEMEIRRFVRLARPHKSLLMVLHISASGGSPKARTFTVPDETDHLIEHVRERNAARCNIYWLPNGTKVTDKKPLKSDIVKARFAWADCDPEAGAGYPASRAFLLEQHAPKLAELATFVIDSGNGLQAFFRLGDPLDITTGYSEYEHANAAIGEAFTGPGTFNCDRIMRVPGTWNWPTPTKIDKGYPTEPGMARILSCKDISYTVGELEGLAAEYGRPVSASQPAVPGVDPETGELDAARRFADLLATDTRLRARWDGSADGLLKASGSEMDLSLYGMLVYRRFAHTDIVEIMTPWPHGSAGGRAQGDRYWTRMQERTLAAPRDDTWLDGWYFLTARDRLTRVGEPGTLSITGFNARFAPEMPVDKNGRKPAAFEFAKNGAGIPIAADLVYAAGTAPVFEFMGHTYVNAYRAASAPATATTYDANGRAAVDLVRAHISLLAGDPDTAHMIETWIAHNVRTPGALLGVALLVKGIQGDGKTILFRQLMGAIMGAENVGDIANAEVRSEFSGWAVGRAVRVVEELKASGHNRHDVLNAIKPYITNQTVPVVRKGQDGFDAMNTTNYVCLTNHEDALPIDDTDRRWWVLFSPFSNISELAARVGDDLAAYFDRLAAAIYGHGDALRKYFLECPLHARVHHNMRAPETEGRRRMILAENNLAGGDFLDSYIAEGEHGISADIIASSELSLRLESDMGDGRPQSRKLAALLASRGFRQCAGPLKWDGRKHRVYVRDVRLVDGTENELGRQRLRKMLDATAKHPAPDLVRDFDPILADGTDLL